MSPLYTKLQELGGLWTNISSAKLKNILQISCCILKSRSCNLQKCRDELPSITGEMGLKQDTAYARLKRVFQTGVVKSVLKSLFLMILHLIGPCQNSLLILDRTDFSVGKRWINLLVIGLEWHGVFIPLIWTDLGERKLSSQQERIDLLDRLLAWWKASTIPVPVLCIVGDREFTGHDWLMALEKREIDYVIRIKSNLRFPVWFKDQLKDRPIQLKVLARYMIKQQLSQMEIVIGQSIVTRLMLLPQEKAEAKEPYVLLITNLVDWQNAQHIFRRRWPIECCFKHMKSNGFDLEALHLEGQHKIDLLFAILTFVYVLAIRQGVLSGFQHKVKMKKAANGKLYPKQSLFRFGLYQLKLLVKELDQLIRYLIRVIEMEFNQFKCKKIVLVNSIVQS